MSFRPFVACLLALVFSGCRSAGIPEVVDPEVLATASRDPRIERVRDLGNPDLPSLGAIRNAQADGTATPGELLLIEGSGFGKQPTIRVSGQDAPALARTEGGGIIVRVPIGIATAVDRVEVLTAKGRSETPFPVRRFALMLVKASHHVHVLEVGKDAHPFGHPLLIDGADAVRYSHDGASAYITAVGQAPQLHVLDMAAPLGPRLVASEPLPEPALALASATGAARLAVVTATQLLLFNGGGTASRRLQRLDALALPEAVVKAGILAAELDPDGTTLAILVARQNHVFLFDLANPRELRLLTIVDVLPGVHQPLLRDMQFSVDGESLWIVSGEGTRGTPAPTKLSVVRIMPGQGKDASRVVSMYRTMSIPGAAAPLGMVLAKGQPVANGSTIRIPPDKAAVFVSAIHEALLRRNGEAKSRTIALPGMIVRADAGGGGGPLFATQQVLGAVDLTPDAQVLVATAWRAASVDGAVGDLALGVVSTPLWGKPAPQFVPLEKGVATDLTPPYGFAALRIQP